MARLMLVMCSSTSESLSLLSGRIRRRVLGASPAMRSTSSQYSGWDVNWSQATTAQRVMSQSLGNRMSAGFMPTLLNFSFIVRSSIFLFL